MGRGGYKQAGFRSVQRIEQPDDHVIHVYCAATYYEWRIVAYAFSEKTLTETIPRGCLVDSWREEDDASCETAIRPWRSEDLLSDCDDQAVVIWEWCRGVWERQGSLLALGDEWWCPYGVQTTSDIEDAFTNKQDKLNINTVPDEPYSIIFQPGSPYALQCNELRGSERSVRRVVKTVGFIKATFARLAEIGPPLDIKAIADSLAAGTIPHDFICPICQDIMEDPVKTCDGMVYERAAIARWLTINPTSPLTGLQLSSVTLEPHVDMLGQIQEFVKAKRAQAPCELTVPPTSMGSPVCGEQSIGLDECGEQSLALESFASGPAEARAAEVLASPVETLAAELPASVSEAVGC